MVHHFLRTIGWWIRNIALVNFDPYPSRNPAPTPADFQQLVPSAVENPGDVYPESSPKFVHLRLSPPPFLFIETIKFPTLANPLFSELMEKLSGTPRLSGLGKVLCEKQLSPIHWKPLTLDFSVWVHLFPIDTGPIKVIYHWQVLFAI